MPDSTANEKPDATVEKPVSPSRPGSKGRSRTILLNAVSSYGRDIIDTIAFLVLIPFIIKTLGSESFGLWSLIWAFLVFFDLADLGFGASVVKFVADARGRQDVARQQKIVCTLFWVYMVLGGVVVGGVLLSLLFFNRLFQIPADQAEAARSVLLILGVRSALYMPLGMFRGILAGHQKMKVDNWYKIVGNLTYFAAVLIFLPMIPDLWLLAALNAVTGVLPLAAMMIHVRRTVPEVSIHPRHFDRTLIREVTSFSLYFSFIQVAGLIATRADAMVIKLFLPLQMVAIYSIGLRLAEKAGYFCSHLNRALSPMVAELHGAAEQANIRAVWYRGTKFTVAFSTPLLLGLALLADPLVNAWTGPEFREAGAVCRWLVAAVTISVFHGSSVNILSMGGHQRLTARALLGGQVLNIILSLLLIQPFGIKGVAMATFFAYVPLYIGTIQIYASRIHERSPWDFYRHTVVPAILPALLMASLFLLVQEYWPLSHLLEVALLEIIGIVVFGVAFWLVGFNTREKDYLREKLPIPLFHRRTA
jgi:O-antigen/teichoic acid export membrane protein